MLGWNGLVATLAVAVLSLGCDAGGTDGGFVVLATVHVPAAATSLGSSDASGCTPRVGYRTVRAGTRVTISDSTGTLVGRGELSPAPRRVGGERLECVFRFAVPGVPTGADGYRIRVGERTAGTFEQDELRVSGLGPVPQLDLGESS